MTFMIPPVYTDALRLKILDLYRKDETECINAFLEEEILPPALIPPIEATARDLILKVRKARLDKKGIDAFLYQYDLSSEEGIALMCLAEAMLRIPDAHTRDDLIKDKITSANWEEYIGDSSSLFVNAATWGLALTGKILSEQDAKASRFHTILKTFIERTSAPVIRQVVSQAMKLLGQQFVMGATIEEALKRAKKLEEQGYRFSYDMLGEAARTQEDAERYFNSYKNAIYSIAKAAEGQGENIFSKPSISIKLSAIHPRYEVFKKERVFAELLPKLQELVIAAKNLQIGLTIDAEEAERLDLSLDIFEALYTDSRLEGWEGLGLAVQAYQKRAIAVLDWLIALGRRVGKRFTIRLVKGAYWDTEIKWSQIQGLEGYPVFTRKVSTDVSYLACAKKLLSAMDIVYPNFATHNAYSVAAILTLAPQGKLTQEQAEFQCLHGMGYPLYQEIVGKDKLDIPCRVYAPVGHHEDLLAYLVRRLLENGANTSFVNKIIDESVSIESLLENPIEKLRHLPIKPHPLIPLPKDIFAPIRPNSAGIDLTNARETHNLLQTIQAAAKETYYAYPSQLTAIEKEYAEPVMDSYTANTVIGYVQSATEEQIYTALNIAQEALTDWNTTTVQVRSKYLEKAAELFTEYRPQLLALLVQEAGKTIADAIAEVREAIDFCYYYAAQARQDLMPHTLPGPTGEFNQLQLHGRGVLACISPWNFPLAIFIGQVVAALVTGNTVIAKPATQTPLVAALAVKLLHQAGVPKEVLQLLPASGSLIGKHLIPDLRIKGVIFTGSTETARYINQTLASREGPIVPFIAETGGQNAMIVDSSALLEQVVSDVITSAFGSAGQRCSALRVLYIQEEIASKFMHMLKGAMAELAVGDPSALYTDVGPVIDTKAQTALNQHIEHMQKEGRCIYQVPLADSLKSGHFVAPSAFEITSIQQLKQEVFGPVLHVISYGSANLDTVLSDIQSTGYGLTLGIHTRINARAKYIQNRLKVGNIYVNRSMIGAVVGVQPFGGEGLSGTGPKAGGPYYLLRLCVERTLTVNTTASGGNAGLMCLKEEG